VPAIGQDCLESNIRLCSASQPQPITQRAAANSSTTFTIPPPKPSRRPANIPLRTLSSPANRSQSEHLLGGHSDEKQGRRSSLSRSDSADSDFGSWSDTGDLAEQLADEDPLQIKLRASLEEEVFGTVRRGSRPKRVRYLDRFETGGQKEHHPGLVKEEIEIPNPAPRYIGRAEHILAAIMTGGERQMHGLTGKPLVYGEEPFS
jgi:hypothetical protein